MTLRPEDLLRLPCDPSLIQAGVTAACRRSLNPRVRRSGHDLRILTAAFAGQLAFRRWLEAQQAPYHLLADAPFTDPALPSLYVGGRRVEVHISLVHGRRAVRSLRRNPSSLLASPLFLQAVVSHPATSTLQDLLVFGVLAGLCAPGTTEARRAVQAGLPCAMVASPPVWLRQRLPSPFTLECIYQGSEAVEVEVIGWHSGRLASCGLTLAPGQSVRLPHDLAALSCLRTAQLPDGPLTTLDPQTGTRWRLSPGYWSNVWVYGMEFILAGWRTRSELQRLTARASAEGTSAHVTDLRPLSELLARLRQGSGTSAR